jgi:L,D-transpeptidase catalytic domain
VSQSRSRRLPSTLLLAIALAVGLGFAAPVRAAADESAVPRPELLQRALAAYHRVEQSGVLRTKLLTVIDYSLPSWTRRLWVVDPTQPARVLFHEFVAHGRGSTDDEHPDYAVRFGNEPSSLRSSLGAFLTGATYSGSHGYSLELYGLDPGVNDKALERKIVMHPAEYVSAAHRAFFGGSVGRSWGCPALDPAVATAVIDRIQNGSLLYVDGATPAAATGPAQLAAAARAPIHRR